MLAIKRYGDAQPGLAWRGVKLMWRRRKLADAEIQIVHGRFGYRALVTFTSGKWWTSAMFHHGPWANLYNRWISASEQAKEVSRQKEAQAAREWRGRG